MDSDDEREDTIPSWKGVPGAIILINVFDASRETAAVAHAATCRMVRQYLRSSSSQMIGVCLYGIEDCSTSAFGTKSVVDVFALTTPTLDDFKKLCDLKLSMYKPAKEFKLSDVVWHCSKMFTNCKKQLLAKTVIMLTKLDMAPIQSDQKPTYLRVGDLVDSNIDIKIINIAENEYKVDIFYENFLNQANKGRGFVLPQPIWDAKEIEKVLHQQSHRHLAVARLKFEIGEGVSIGVGVYNLLIRSTYQKKFSLDRESNAVLASVTKTMKVSTDTTNPTSPMDIDDQDNEPKPMPLLRSEILYYQEYGTERVEFTDSEMKKLKNPFGPPMMKLLGFKPTNVMCKEKRFLKSGYFLFPNEGLIEGSTVAFKALYQACVETGMVAVCILCTRVNAKPVTVALSPCTHPLGLDVEIGFDVVQIPFVENVRDLPPPEDEEINISNQQKLLMKDIIQKLKFDYKPDMFENPKLQSEYRAIEAIALDEDDLDPFVDTTKRAPELFERIQEDIFEELFGPFEQTATKRFAPSSGSSGCKRVKGEEINDSLVQDKIKSQTVHQFTVVQLREILKNDGNSEIPALNGLKKSELVELVYKYCSN